MEPEKTGLEFMKEKLQKLKTEQVLLALKYQHGGISLKEFKEKSLEVTKRERFLIDYNRMKAKLEEKRRLDKDKPVMDIVKDIINEALPRLDPTHLSRNKSFAVEGINFGEKNGHNDETTGRPSESDGGSAS